MQLGSVAGPCNPSKWEAEFWGWLEVWRPALLCFTVNQCPHWAWWQYGHSEGTQGWLCERVIWVVWYNQQLKALLGSSDHAPSKNLRSDHAPPKKKRKWPCSTKIWETTMLHLKKWKLCIPPKFEKTTMLQQNYAGYSIEWQLPTFDKFLEPHLNLLTTSSSSVDSAHFVSA